MGKDGCGKKEIPPPNVGGMVARYWGVKGETRAARSETPLPKIVSRRPCFPLPFVRKRAPFRETRQR